MEGKLNLGPVLMLLSLGLAAATRFPGAHPVANITAVVVGFVAVSASLAAWFGPKGAKLGGIGLVATFAFLLLPTSATALGANVPAWFVAAFCALSLHTCFGRPRSRAPVVALSDHASKAGSVAWLTRLVPFAAVAVGPILYEVVTPPRIHRAYEIQSVLAPLGVVLFVAGALLLVGALRQVVADENIRSAEEESSDAEMRVAEAKPA